MISESHTNQILSSNMKNINRLHASIMLAVGFIVGLVVGNIALLTMPDTWDVAVRAHEIRRKHLILERLVAGEADTAARQLATEINSDILLLDRAAKSRIRFPGVGEGVKAELAKVKGYRESIRVDYAGLSDTATFQSTLTKTEEALAGY